MAERQHRPSRAGQLYVGLVVLLGLALLGVLAVRVWDLARYSWLVLHYPDQIDYDEGVNLHAALLLSQGRSIYTSLDPNSFVAATHPPLFYVLAAVPLRWTGPAFAWGRVIILLSALGTAALLGVMAGHAARRWFVGVLCALFFLALSPVRIWANLYKQDMLALFFTVAGLYMVQRYPERRGVYLAVPMFVLAFFTKHTALVGPAVGVVYLWLHGVQSVPGGIRAWAVWRRALVFALVCAAAILIPFVLLDIRFHHNLYLHMITFNNAPWDLGRTLKNVRKLVTEHPFLIALDLCAAAYLVYRRRNLIYPLYLLVATGAILVANGFPAANYNHLLDILPPLCLLFAAFIGELWEAHQYPAARVVLILTLLGLTWQGLNLSAPDAWYHGLPTPERARRMEAIRRFLVTKPDPILSEDVGILLLSGHTVEYDDPWMFTRLALTGLWDDRVLVQKISSHYFSFVLLEYDITELTGATRWSPRVFQALKDNYDLLYRDQLYTYQPKAQP